MTYVSVVALARAIGFERLSTVITCCVRLGGAVDKATRLLKLPRDHLMSKHRIVLPKKDYKRIAASFSHSLIKSAPGHQPSPIPVFANMLANQRCVMS